MENEIKNEEGKIQLTVYMKMTISFEGDIESDEEFNFTDMISKGEIDFGIQVEKVTVMDDGEEYELDKDDFGLSQDDIQEVIQKVLKD